MRTTVFAYAIGAIEDRADKGNLKNDQSELIIIIFALAQTQTMVDSDDEDYVCAPRPVCFASYLHMLRAALMPVMATESCATAGLRGNAVGRAAAWAAPRRRRH